MVKWGLSSVLFVVVPLLIGNSGGRNTEAGEGSRASARFTSAGAASIPVVV